ncbi:MAG: SUMF1/EgtB/PvdO family nonheme iron enzyme [Rhizobiales bacterium]|nr:SUMF1/EgtB/PvdO family nonheme iron enzyme [Hyphomicrobiales bacterium]
MIGQRLTDCDVCPEMVVLPPGTVQLGSPEHEPARQPYEGPQLAITFKKPFAISRTEITLAQYQAFMTATGYVPSKECRSGDASISAVDVTEPGYLQTPSHPAVCLSRLDAKHYVAWLSERTGRAYRLPSASEWEYAARAGSETAYAPGPELLNTSAHFASRAELGIAPGSRGVGSYGPNSFDVLDMHGNVAEWVEDCWYDPMSLAPQNGNALSVGYTCPTRIVKGGAWYSDAADLRSAARREVDEKTADNGIGVRVVRDM